MSFDPRTIAKPVYQKLGQLKASTHDAAIQKEQKNQAIELYTYLSTWGMMRLKAEEYSLKEGKKQVVKYFFNCLEEIAALPELSSEKGLDLLTNMETDEYLGLMGLGLAIAQEFSFWGNAVYFDVKGE